MSEGKIYKIQNRVNSKIYVGSTQNIQERWDYHKRQLRNDRHGNIHLQNAFNKYGVDSFEFSVIEEVKDIENLIDREQYYMDNLEPEYNMIPKANRSEMSEEIKRKISESLKDNGKFRGENNPFFGKTHSEETKREMSKARKGREVSKETRKKISESLKGRELSEEHKKKISASEEGKEISEETRRKISKANSGRELSEAHKKKIGEGNKGKELSKKTKDKLSESHKNPSEETRRKISEAMSGEKSPSAKLTDKKVKVILHLLNGGSFTQKQIGKMFGVSSSTISAIHMDQTWEHIEI